MVRVIEDYISKIQDAQIRRKKTDLTIREVKISIRAFRTKLIQVIHKEKVFTKSKTNKA